MKPLYTLDRSGSFIAGLKPSGKCGLPATSIFTYAVSISARELDEDKFVLDQFEVERLFDRWSEVDGLTASCEALAGGSLRGLWALMHGRAESIKVRIGPTGVAGIELLWNRGDELPVIVPVKELNYGQSTSEPAAVQAQAA